MKATRSQSIAHLLKESGQDDEATAAQLAALLEDHPVALSLACAYLRETKTPLPQYLEALLKVQEEILSQGVLTEEHVILVVAHYTSVWFWITAPRSILFVNALAFFALEDSPQKLLLEETVDRSNAPSLVPEGTPGSLELLKRYGLLKEKGDAVSLPHPLVQLAVRWGFPKELHEMTLQFVLLALWKGMPESPRDASRLAEVQKLLPHIKTAVSHASSLGVCKDTAARLLCRAGSYLVQQRETEVAIPLLSQAVPLALEGHEELPPYFPSLFAKLGRMLLKREETSKARGILRGALQLARKAYPESHPEVLAIEGLLAHLEVS